MTVEDLRGFWRRGMPVICPVQDYANFREPGATFDYGHYLTVIGAAMGFVFCQDSSIENAEDLAGGDVAGGDLPDSNIAAPGRIMVTEAEWMKAWHDMDVDGNKYLQFGIAVSKDILPEPPPEQTSAPPTDGKPAPPVPGKAPPSTPSPAPSPAPPPEPPPDPGNPWRAERAAVVQAAKTMLVDVVRRMTRRIGTQAERAAADRKKFAQWLTSVIVDNAGQVRDAAEPAERALAALGGKRGLSDWLLERLHREFDGLTERVTVANLPSGAAALAGELAANLPGEAAEAFLARCGGPGSGVPGPCATAKEVQDKAVEAVGKMEGELGPEIEKDPELKSLAARVYDKVASVVKGAVFSEFPAWAAEHADVWMFEHAMNTAGGSGSVMAVKVAGFAASKAYMAVRGLLSRSQRDDARDDDAPDADDQTQDLHEVATKLHGVMMEIASVAGFSVPSMAELTAQLKTAQKAVA
jgi:hypothetical protein